MKKKFLLGATASLLLVSTGCNNHVTPTLPAVTTYDQPYTEQLKVGSKNLRVQIVTSEKDMAQGLSGRSSLGDQQGMLFDFGSGNSTTPGFWMKDMVFNLDLIWIKNNKIIFITPRVPAQAGVFDDKLIIYSPPSPVDSVLEVNAGWTEKNHIKIGDSVIAE